MLKKLLNSKEVMVQNLLVRGGKFLTLEGEKYPRTVIWEFPSYEQAINVMILKNIKMVGLSKRYY